MTEGRHGAGADQVIELALERCVEVHVLGQDQPEQLGSSPDRHDISLPQFIRQMTVEDEVRIAVAGDGEFDPALFGNNERRSNR